MKYAKKLGRIRRERRRPKTWAVVMPCDQTIAFVTDDGSSTTVHRRAKLFASYAEAQAVADDITERVRAHWRTAHLEEPSWDTWADVEPIADIVEFQRRPDTW